MKLFEFAEKIQLSSGASRSSAKEPQKRKISKEIDGSASDNRNHRAILALPDTVIHNIYFVPNGCKAALE